MNARTVRWTHNAGSHAALGGQRLHSAHVWGACSVDACVGCNPAWQRAEAAGRGATLGDVSEAIHSEAIRLTAVHPLADR